MELYTITTKDNAKLTVYPSRTPQVYLYKKDYSDEELNVFQQTAQNYLLMVYEYSYYFDNSTDEFRKVPIHTDQYVIENGRLVGFLIKHLNHRYLPLDFSKCVCHSWGWDHTPGGGSQTWFLLDANNTDADIPDVVPPSTELYKALSTLDVVKFSYTYCM